MTGGSLVGLTLLSMAWLFFAGGAVMNFSLLRRAAKAKPGERGPSGDVYCVGWIILFVFFRGRGDGGAS